eukprot:TRINITY_DN14346_c0_g1_i2.p3 TRINITY_DN14346_c0_g1~~TRINITY_DN14346_c0_g1_i2.p3  ORF type:complete len:100 (+),score=13.35 TRINITY_DN14346_c0_g1_i2:383-682(+)
MYEIIMKDYEFYEENYSSILQEQNEITKILSQYQTKHPDYFYKQKSTNEQQSHQNQEKSLFEKINQTMYSKHNLQQLNESQYIIHKDKSQNQQYSQNSN